MAKYVLGNSDDELKFALLGISSAEDQYSIVALLDHTLNINLRLQNYIPYTLKESRIFKFSLYTYLDEILGLEYNLIPNASNFEEPNINATPKDLFETVNVDESVKLIKELPKTDYFLILKGEDIYNYQFKIANILKQQVQILQVQTIEPIDLPSKRNLIF